MHKIVSLPPSLVKQFNQISELPSDEWFATTDPNGVKVGSGGGTAWAIADFELQTHSNQKRIIIHAGGQSRRLPSYAPSGKILTPERVGKENTVETDEASESTEQTGSTISPVLSAMIVFTNKSEMGKTNACN